MPLEALAAAELLPGLLAYDHYQGQHPDGPYVSALLEALSSGRAHHHPQSTDTAMPALQQQDQLQERHGLGAGQQQQQVQQHGSGRKKRRRRARVCKNKEEAETQRMTHIAVERNRRRQMNEHLAALRALMPDSYIQRGDQASIVGGAIDFVKELEQLLQSLEAQKHAILQRQYHQQRPRHHRRQRPDAASMPVTASHGAAHLEHDSDESDAPPVTAASPLAQFFSYPQYVRWSAGAGSVRDCCQQAAEAGARQLQLQPHQHPHHRSAASGVADIEVTLVETHASMRILSPRRPGQLLRMVAGFHALQLTILHLNLTTLEPLVLYTISAKVEEGCSLTTVDDIAAAVHHMLTLIEAEGAASAVFCS